MVNLKVADVKVRLNLGLSSLEVWHCHQLQFAIDLLRTVEPDSSQSALVSPIGASVLIQLLREGTETASRKKSDVTLYSNSVNRTVKKQILEVLRDPGTE